MIDCKHASPTDRESVVHCNLGNPRIGEFPHIGVCRTCKHRVGRDGTAKENLPDWEDYTEMTPKGKSAGGCEPCEQGMKKNKATESHKPL